MHVPDMTVSSTDFRRRVGYFVRHAERGATVTLVRRGEPVSVLVGIGAYEQMQWCISEYQRLLEEVGRHVS